MVSAGVEAGEIRVAAAVTIGDNAGDSVNIEVIRVDSRAARITLQTRRTEWRKEMRYNVVIHAGAHKKISSITSRIPE